MAKDKRFDPKVEHLRESGSLHPRPQDVRDPLFRENAFFDPRDLVQVKYEMLRRVEREGQTVTEAVAAFGFARPSFYKSRRSFQKEGLCGLIPKKRGPRQPHKLTEEVRAFIQQARDQDSQLDAMDLVRLIEKEFGVIVHPRTVERALQRAKKKPRGTQLPG